MSPLSFEVQSLWRVRQGGILARLFSAGWSPWRELSSLGDCDCEGPIRVGSDGAHVMHLLGNGEREHLYRLEHLLPYVTIDRLRAIEHRGALLAVSIRAGRIVGASPSESEDSADSGGKQAAPLQLPVLGSTKPGEALSVFQAAAQAFAAELGMGASSQALRWVDGVSPPPVLVLPSKIPTSFRGKINLVKKGGKILVCQHLPHPGGRDYQFYLLGDMPLSEGELERAEWRQATVIVTMQNGKVVDAKIPRGQEWGRGLNWDRGRSGYYWGR